MGPKIEVATFGRITVNGESFDHDIVIGLSGEITKRKKKLSKQVFGTSHIISCEEVEQIFEEGCKTLIIGAGLYGQVKLSEDAQKFLNERGVECILQPTVDAMKKFNLIEGAKIGLFHVTC